MNLSVESVSGVAVETASQARQTSDAAQVLGDVAGELQEVVGAFTV